MDTFTISRGDLALLVIWASAHHRRLMVMRADNDMPGDTAAGHKILQKWKELLGWEDGT